MTADNEPRFSTQESARLLGLSFRGLDELVRRNIVKPTVNAKGIGSSRRWSFSDVAAVKVALDWVNRGVDWRAIQRAVGYVQKKGLANIAEFPLIVVSGARAWGAKEESAFVGTGGMHLLVSDLRPGIAVLRRRVQQFTTSKQKKKIGAVAQATT